MLMNPKIQSITREDRALLGGGTSCGSIWSRSCTGALLTQARRTVHAWLRESHAHAETHASPRNEDRKKMQSGDLLFRLICPY